MERQAGSSDYRKESGSYLDAVARISTKDWLPDFQGNDGSCMEDESKRSMCKISICVSWSILQT